MRHYMAGRKRPTHAQASGKQLLFATDTSFLHQVL